MVVPRTVVSARAMALCVGALILAYADAPSVQALTARLAAAAQKVDQAIAPHGLRQVRSVQQEVVARAAGQTLTVSRFATMIAPQRKVQLSRDVMGRIAEMWVDYQLLGQAVASGDSLTDTATVMEASWPVVMQNLANRLHDSLITSQVTLTDHQVDSAYYVGSERWLSHILVASKQDTTPEVRTERRRVAQGYLAQLRAGTPFARFAAQESDDRATAANGGSLGLVGRGALVRAFEDAGWALQPGETSDVVETAFGFHIIRRPALNEIRDSFRLRLRQLLVSRLDSLFVDSLATKSGIDVRSSAAVTLRLMANDPWGARGDDRVLASFRGGTLTVTEMARWLQALPAQTRGMLLQADDSTVIRFVGSIARNEVILGMVRAQGLTLSPAARDTIFETFRSELKTLRTSMGLDPESLATTDPQSHRSRTEAAASRVDDYVAAITANRPGISFQPVPPFLAYVLRGRYAWSISTAGVDRALELAARLREDAPLR